MTASKKHMVKRAAQTAAFTVGGGIALTFALSGSAHADVVDQDANVVNAGVGVANSGGNVAVGNNSHNTAATGQAAVGGGVASNVANTSNKSNGTAEVETGNATAVGNHSSTDIDQHADNGNGPGPDVTVQHAGVVNAGIGLANTGGNVAMGNNSQNTVTGQLAVGFLASNVANTSNESDGYVGISTGDATAVGNDSKTKVKQHAKQGDGPGLAVVAQDTGVLNLGFGAANTGGNVAVGNNSQNTAATFQGALGFFASNIANTKNHSNGGVVVKTGNASAIGNHSSTDIEQGADVDPDAFAVVVQHAPVVNAGIGLANTGGNVDVGNNSNNHAFAVQVSFGPFASNIANTENWSDGFVMQVTGDATGIGNDSSTTVKQYA